MSPYEDAVHEHYRWGCCDGNADQKACDHDCPRTRVFASLRDGPWCANCKAPVGQHKDGKCLFASTTYAPITVEAFKEFLAAHTRDHAWGGLVILEEPLL